MAQKTVNHQRAHGEAVIDRLAAELLPAALVVRTTRGMKEHGHENVGMGHYISFAAQLGLSGMLRLGVSFARAVAEMFRLRRAHLSDAAKALRLEHDERVAKLATVTRLGLERLRALLKLQASPITATVAGIMRGVLLDRLAVAVGGVLMLALVAIFGASTATRPGLPRVSCSRGCCCTSTSRGRVSSTRPTSSSTALHTSRSCSLRPSW